MKIQYLGDSKDAFKWDYHDYLASSLGFPLFKVALMLTPDDGGTDGHSRPELFPARASLNDFCHILRRSRDANQIKSLARIAGAAYRVELHKPGQYFSGSDRAGYFADIAGDERQLLLLDPDNGFEPARSISDKHVGYRDIEFILAQQGADSVVTVFQHHRRKAFPDDLGEIRRRLPACFSSAIYWHSLMFVALSRDRAVIDRLRLLNRDYAAHYPVTVID